MYIERITTAWGLEMANTRRVTIKVYERLWDSFTKQTEDLFLKRDAFLNHVIRSEIPQLIKEIGGRKLSQKARLYISRELSKLVTIPVNIVLDEDVATSLDGVVKEANLVRDAFINRLIMWLRSQDALLNSLGMPLRPNDQGTGDSLPVSPMKAMEEVRDDPFCYIRAYLEKDGEGLYTLDLTSILTPAMSIGLSCYLDDEKVPGTEAYVSPEEEEAI